MHIDFGMVDISFGQVVSVGRNRLRFFMGILEILDTYEGVPRIKLIQIVGMIEKIFYFF